eukprot:1186421-Prorocentrum_minimum.AAC.3
MDGIYKGIFKQLLRRLQLVHLPRHADNTHPIGQRMASLRAAVPADKFPPTREGRPHDTGSSAPAARACSGRGLRGIPRTAAGPARGDVKGVT